MAWVSPITWTAGVLTSANLNTIRDALKAIGDPMTAYTPTLTATTTNPVLGAGGTITGKYSAAGKRIDFDIEVVWGGAGLSAGSGTFELTLPVAAAASFYPVGRLAVRTAGGTRTNGQMWAQSTTVIRGAMTSTDALFGATTIAWATGDRFNISGTYEAA